MIVRLEADGAVVRDADDCSALHLETPLDSEELRTALHGTGTGTLVDAGPRPEVVLDLAVLRSRARLVASASDWAQRWEEMVAAAGDRLTDHGLGLRVPVERPGG